MLNERLELVSHTLCPYVQRVAIALAEKGAPFERIYIDLADKPDWFVAISPLAKVPLLKVDGGVLFESAAICEYLDDTIAPGLHPAAPLVRARHRAWIEFASSVLSAIGGFYSAPDAGAFEQRRLELKARFATVEAELGDGQWFGGMHFSLVDAAFAPALRYFEVFDMIGDFGLFDATPKLNAWRLRLAQRPSVIAAVTADYPALLLEFVRKRRSHLAAVATEPMAARR